MAHFVIGCDVVIDQYRFHQVNEIKVVSSWKNLNDTAVIKLPLLKGKTTKGSLNETLADKIKVGKPVSIKMSYIGHHDTYEFEEFTGFVKSLSQNVPLQIDCEDGIYLLRKINIEETLKKTTLKDILSFIAEEANKQNDYKISIAGNIPEVHLSSFRMDNMNGAEVLQKLKEEFGFVAYFKGLKLFCGLAYTDLIGKVKLNLAGNTISNDLVFKKGEDKRIMLKAIAILKDNKKLEVEVGDKSGEQRTLFYYKVTNEKNLKEFADADLKMFKADSCEGRISTFLIPQVKHSMSAEIIDPDFQFRNGNYMVDEVETTFGKGIKREIRLGIRLGKEIRLSDDR